MPDRIVTEDQWEKSMRKLQVVKRCFKNGENQEGARLTDEIIDDIRGWKNQTAEKADPAAKDNPHVVEGPDQKEDADSGSGPEPDDEESPEKGNEDESSEVSGEDTEDEEESESEDKDNSDPLSFSTKD